jgi:putative FmdB family regulatory protein
MPIYEYECTKCGNHMEALQKFSDSPLSKCEACGGRLRKLMSHSTFHLKGTGWYVTDYASKSGGNQGSSPKHEAKPKAEAKTESGSSAKKESSDS